MENKNITKIEHRWCEKDDRWVYIAYDKESKICGLNFMQGDEYELFQKNWGNTDKELTNFYLEMRDIMHVEFVSSDKIGFINKCIWAYVVARNN